MQKRKSGRQRQARRGGGGPIIPSRTHEQLRTRDVSFAERHILYRALYQAEVVIASIFRGKSSLSSFSCFLVLTFGGGEQFNQLFAPGPNERRRRCGGLLTKRLPSFLPSLLPPVHSIQLEEETETAIRRHTLYSFSPLAAFRTMSVPTLLLLLPASTAASIDPT